MTSRAVVPDKAFWEGKRVLLTGHTGFKGGWLTIWLNKLGAKVVGIGLPPETTPNLFTLSGVDRLCESNFNDIRDMLGITEIVRKTQPEIVFHLAAQPLVRASYQKPVETFSTNILGTAHVLDALRGLGSVRTAVMITTDKVYRNSEWPWPYREEDALGGYDPYSASKAACEIVIESYRKAFLAEQGVAVASARAGNVIGGGDWATDRLIPDVVRAWQAGQLLHIRRPQAVRPWQHVLEPLAAYLRLAEQLWANPHLAGAYNFGPETQEAASVGNVVSIARQVYGSGEVHVGGGTEGPHETGWLALEIAKARTLLGVQPRWTLETAVEKTMNWYRAQHDGANARELCLSDMAAFEAQS